MCAYCMVGDHFFRFDPPWYVPPSTPFVPRPAPGAGDIYPWNLERLREVEDMLKRIKALEDKLGCPCEPNKADYLAMFRERIEKLEKQVDGDSPKGGLQR